MADLTWLWSILGYFVAYDKMLSVDFGKNWADHVS